MSGRRKDITGCTLAQCAEYKQLPVEFLQRLGLSDAEYDGAPAVLIPYMDENGEVVCKQYRLRLEKKKDQPRFHFESGSKTCPYGLWRVEDARRMGYAVLTEGASDPQTLWFHGFPALGLPSSSSWREEWVVHLDRIERIHLVVEPDSGGRTLLRKMAESSLVAQIRVVRMAAAAAKDPSELYLQDPQGFADKWRALMEAAEPLVPRATRSNPTARAKQLSSYSSAVGLEKNCAQLIPLGREGRPTWRPQTPRRDVERRLGTVRHLPLMAKNSFLGLSADGFLALAYQHKLCVDQDMPEVVEFFGDDLATSIGAKGRAGVVRVLYELQSGSLSGMLSISDGKNSRPVRGELRAIDWFSIRANGVCRVGLPDLVVENLRNDFTAYLDHATLVTLRRTDPLGMRTWVYAEAQNLMAPKLAKDGISYCVFPTRYTAKKQTPTFDVLLGLTRMDQPAALERLRPAAKAVKAADPKYDFSVDPGKTAESWLLKMRRLDARSVNER